jgi:DNA helicase-2/ATP-dependent DNA helicase PcrA
VGTGLIVDRLLNGLNASQRQAVTHQSGPLLVAAGAGTGKTKVVIHRLATLLDQGLVPSQVLAVTFTNRAADEVRARVVGLVGPPGARVNIGTFHWLGNRILRRYGTRLPIGANFTLASPRESTGVLRDVSGPLVAAGWSAVDLQDSVSALRNGSNTEPAAEVRMLRDAYVAELRRRRLLDLDDLILASVELLRTHTDVRSRLESFFGHVLVDEYQDSNRPQVELLSLLVGRTGNITAVGDDDQAIYSWRYASADGMVSFGKTFPGSTLVRLEENYRSTQRILSPANALLTHNELRVGKNLVATRRAGKKPVILAASTETEEADVVAESIAARLIQGTVASRIAVLFRTNVQSRPLEEALVRAGISYQMRSGQRFYDRPEIAGVIDALAVVVAPDDSERWERLLMRLDGVGPARARVLADSSAMHGSESAPRVPHSVRHKVDDLRTALRSVPVSGTLVDIVATVAAALEHMIGEPGGHGGRESRDENIAEFVSMAGQFMTEWSDDNALEQFLDRLNLLGSLETDGDNRSERVQLMTLHAAKGLEFDAVFVTGLEEGLLPHRKSMLRKATLEEERRLLYVGMTRARDHLALSYARTRLIGGKGLASSPSRFLDEMPRNLFDVALTESKIRMQRLRSVALADRVEHPRWGAGTVIAVAGEGRGTMITIEFERVGTKSVQLRFAPLNRIS